LSLWTGGHKPSIYVHKVVAVAAACVPSFNRDGVGGSRVGRIVVALTDKIMAAQKLKTISAVTTARFQTSVKAVIYYIEAI
jgi:hypothetical protein